MAKLRSRQNQPTRFARTTSQRAGFCSGFVLAEGQAAPFVLAEHYQFVLSAGDTSPFNDKSGNNEPAGAVQKSGEHGRLQFLNFGWLYECADIPTVMAITECPYYLYLLHLRRAWRTSCLSLQTNCPSVIGQLRPSAETADRACPKVVTTA